MRSVSRFGKFVLEAGRHPPMRRHQRGCSQRQYHLALLPHPAFKFPKRHVSWPRFFSSIHFTSEGETYMAKIHWALAYLLLFVTAAAAQEHYTEGPVWRVTLVRVKPAQMDAYLTSLRQATKPLLEEEKRTGAIVDYKIFLKETNSGPQDWDLALAVQYKNHAAMDGLTAKGEAVRDKIMGGKQQAQQVAEKRQEIREIVSSELLQEIMLK